MNWNWHLMSVQRKFAVIGFTLALGGCATAPPSGTTSAPARAPAEPAPAAVNLSGFPPEFRSGYNDGCASVGSSASAPRRRDEARFKTDASYAQGWRDGYDICRRRQ